ncbi:STAS/SEC14 domain-containing protein [Sphingomonas crocodyli]|uniref:STAS/SEC14 domain-containing protein n=1 Tax=Sphingomonas crocodyli TaxID=1979270 RepID=A0A437M9R6_9SPHN|nr:STAS/SEC14 domain-containing protein [Sphingomonas crocodyli]RVT94366.1 STAS/SEC14 domain-containing protein [Sphingomonas crocodyli]
MYEVSFRHDINLLDIAWHGLFDADGVAAYTRDVKSRFLFEGFRPGYLLRMDMRESAVQTREALIAFRQEMADFPKARKIAVITNSAIAKLQIQREMPQPYLRIFTTPFEAMAWLEAPEAAH